MTLHEQISAVEFEKEEMTRLHQLAVRNNKGPAMTNVIIEIEAGLELIEQILKDLRSQTLTNNARRKK